MVEGDTEETIINLILESLAIDPDRDGFIIHNLVGQSNIKILPIEHILKKVFGIFPELSFASTTIFG